MVICTVLWGIIIFLAHLTIIIVLLLEYVVFRKKNPHHVLRLVVLHHS